MIADRIKQSLVEFVRSALAGVDYLGKYDAKIVSQTADGTKVDVRPFDARLPGMKNVPLRNGLPDTVCKVSPGGSVLVGWDGGDPRKPYAVAGWSGATVTSVEVGSPADSVITKQDFDALIAALNAALCAGSGSPINFVTPLPSVYASNVFKVKR